MYLYIGGNISKIENVRKKMKAGSKKICTQLRFFFYHV